MCHEIFKIERPEFNYHFANFSQKKKKKCYNTEFIWQVNTKHWVRSFDDNNRKHFVLEVSWTILITGRTNYLTGLNIRWSFWLDRKERAPAPVKFHFQMLDERQFFRAFRPNKGRAGEISPLVLIYRVFELRRLFERSWVIYWKLNKFHKKYVFCD